YSSDIPDINFPQLCDISHGGTVNNVENITDGEIFSNSSIQEPNSISLSLDDHNNINPECEDSGISQEPDQICNTNFEELFQDSGSSYWPCEDSDDNDDDLEKSTEMVEHESENTVSNNDAENGARKRLRMKGQKYEGVKKTQNSRIVVKKSCRKMGRRCESKKCANSTDKRKCHAITEKQRDELFTKSWSDMDWKQRKTFVAAVVNKVPTVQKQQKESRVEILLSFTTLKSIIYKQGNVEDNQYQEHINQKNRARQEKCKDKDSAMSGEICAYTMDVQAVQLVPRLQAGIIYFKQKLACHNFTIHSLSDDKVVCYVWHEGEGGLYANCFASCITDFSQNEVNEENKDKAKVFYSDGCCAQNRNQLLSNTLLHYCITNNETVIQKYLIKGHSQMKCNTVHSTIENAKKGKDIHAPSNYVQLIQQARKRPTKGPYVIK
ncbi:hypothetical protein ILUMI_01773, partial [Ignelater luminosus]